MSKRFTDTDKWKKNFYRSLTPKLKCLWDYMTCDCNIAGLWDVDIEIAAIRIGEAITENEALEAFRSHIVIIKEHEKWFIPSFIEFQYGMQLSKNNNVFKAIQKVLDKYNLYEYLTVDIVDEGTTISAHRERLTRRIKDAIYAKFNNTCQYCQEEKATQDLVVDHFVPLKKGGDNSDENLVCSCKRCNRHKSDIMPSDFLARNHFFLSPTNYIKQLNAALVITEGASKPSEGDQVKDKDIVKDKDEENVLGIDATKKVANEAWTDQAWRETICMACTITEPELKKWMAQFNASISNDAMDGFNPAKYKKLFRGFLNNEQRKGVKVMVNGAESPALSARFKTINQ